MIFENVIEVDSEEVNPLDRLTKEDLAPQLSIGIEDLLESEKEIKQKNQGLLNELKKDVNYITTDNGWCKHFFDLATNPGRRISSRRSSDSETQTVPGEIVVAKGSGFWRWLSRDNFFECASEPKTKKRKYPILVKKDYELRPHKFLGGITTEFSCFEYVNSLILGLLIKRHGIQMSTYTPLKVARFKELALLEDGEIKKISIEDYCNPDFKPDSENTVWGKYYRIPEVNEARDLSEFFYVGSSIDMRVPPVTFKDETDNRYYSDSMLFRKGMSQGEINEKITAFAKKIKSLMKFVHEYGGTFSQLRDNGVAISSLAIGNVSLDGIVCDLDTLNFTRPKNLSELQGHDKAMVSQTIKAYTNLYKN